MVADDDNSDDGAYNLPKLDGMSGVDVGAVAVSVCFAIDACSASTRQVDRRQRMTITTTARMMTRTPTPPTTPPTIEELAAESESDE